MAVVSVQNLTIKYNDFTAVDSVSFDIASGQAVGILGSNGAGKSSSLRVIAGVNPPSAGKVFIDGLDMTSPDNVDKGRLLTGYCPDVGGLIKAATPREHIGIMLAARNKLYLWEQALELVERFNLSDFIDQPTTGFSHGMSRRLSVILAVLASQRVLILDEPFDGVDPNGVDTTISIIQEAKAAGLGIILSTHLQELLVRATDDVLIMNKGSIIASGSADEFAGSEGAARYAEMIKVNKTDGNEKDN